MITTLTLVQEIQERFPSAIAAEQETRDGIPAIWVSPGSVKTVLSYLKTQIERPYVMLYDLFVIDERVRADKASQPVPADYTVVYHLVSFDRNDDFRVKTALIGNDPVVDSITNIWPAANWYEREAWDMFGVRFTGHPNLRRILMPNTWVGHPLRKDHPARATEIEPYQLSDVKLQAEQEALQFRPEEWGLKSGTDEFDYLFLNLGPHHPGTHGLLRIILQLDGEEIVEAI